MAGFEKGARVRIVSGDGEGVTGEIFWWGESKYDDGMRAGVRGDDGETYWADAEDLAPEVTVKAEAVPQVSFDLPFVAAHPRNGAHQTEDADAETVEAGPYVDGLRHGLFRTVDADGQVLRELEWENGLRHGAIREWNGDGDLVTEGEYRNHKPAEEWRHFHPNGELKESFAYDEHGEKHGPYVWNLDDGSPRGRGEFYHGLRHGPWEWTQGDDYDRSIRGYRRGANHGEAARWYPDGQLEYRVHYELGRKHGDEKRFHPDGSPAFEGTWRHGYGVGTHRTWDETGAEAVTEFLHGLPAERDESGEVTVGFDVNEAAKKVREESDEYRKETALDEFVEFGERSRALFHMWKEGAYDVPGDPDTWGLFQNTSGLFDGSDLVEFLRDASTEGSGGHLPGWPRSLDRLVMEVYARDPEPIDAASTELSDEKVRNGLALVRARFGHDIGETLHGELESLVHEHVHNYGLSGRIRWPVDGVVEEVELFEDHKKKPTDYFMKFIEFFGGYDAWADALEAEALALLDDDRDISFTTFRPVVERADEDLFVRLCTSISLNSATQDLLRSAVFDWRGDDGDAITRLAVGVEDDGLRKWPLTSLAVLKLAEEGAEIPDELIDTFELGVASPTYSSQWVTDATNSIPEEFRHDPHYLVAALPTEHGANVPGVSMVHDALAELSEEQTRRIFERHLDSKNGKLKVAPYLYLVDDSDLWERVIELVEEDDHGARPEKTWTLGEIGLPIVPLIVEALERSEDRAFQCAWRAAIVCALDRAAVDGEEIPADYDQHIDFDLVEQDYYYSHIEPIVGRLLYNLPTDRAAPIIEAGLAGDHFDRAMRCVSSHPTRELLDAAFRVVLEKEATMDDAAQRAFEHMLAGLPNPADWARWMMQNGGGAGVKRALMNAVGHKTYSALEEELENPVEELDHIDKVATLAEEVGGGQRLYLLRRLDEAKHDDLNVIGGTAPGVGADRWPVYDDEPMEHLYTLDLETMPELADRYDARAISVFCHSPGFNEAWEAGTSQTAVLFTTEGQIVEATDPPEEVSGEPEAWFEVVAVDADLSHDKLQREIYGAAARVLGPPIWLQGEDYFGDFVMQFDEQFVHMNLGDAGIMYVFADTAFWQCH